MKLLPLLIVGVTLSLSLNLVSIIPAIAQTAPICKNPNGRTRDRTNPTETQRNVQGCVVQPYLNICAFNWSAWSDPSSNFADLDPFRQTVVSIGSAASIVEIYLGLWPNSHFRQCCKQINALNIMPPGYEAYVKLILYWL